jgi:long-subunit fatty acid transport protein
MSFDRELGERSDPRGLDLELTGADFKGFRAGVQYRPNKGFSIGAVYRSKVTLTAAADDGIALTQNATDLELPFTLPAHVGGGIRSDYRRFGAAFDATYSFQSQNERSALSGLVNGNLVQVPNVFEWRDAFTVRFGFEYRLGPTQEVPMRVGYVYDDRVTSRAYPSVFGTPPSATRSLTIGSGYVAESWELNLALALRSGGHRVRPSELGPAGACPTCGFAGEYKISGVGLYVDFSTELDL